MKSAWKKVGILQIFFILTIWPIVIYLDKNFYANNDQHPPIEELLSNPGIIRNKLKINAAIHNAKQVVVLQSEFGSFKNWLNENKGLSLEEWVKLFKKTFKFTGGEITKEFLVSTGYMKGAHIESCPIHNIIRNSCQN